MRKILVSGIVNLETTCCVRGFPIDYAPIDYNFFGVNTAVSGVGYNISKALITLDNSVDIATMLGNDISGDIAVDNLNSLGVNLSHVARCLKATPASVILYDGEGRRKIYCDLKDVQETAYDFDDIDLCEYDLVIACNVNFNRPLLSRAKAVGIPIATDVHVLSNIDDGYNREFMEYADILFLSDECIPCEPEEFLMQIEQKYSNKIIVLGRGGRGALMYVRSEDKFYDLPAVHVGEVVNTVGAGDALFSSFICFYSGGMTPLESLKRAEVFASAKICTNGAAEGFVTQNKLEKLYVELDKDINEQ